MWTGSHWAACTDHGLCQMIQEHSQISQKNRSLCSSAAFPYWKEFRQITHFLVRPFRPPAIPSAAISFHKVSWGSMSLPREQHGLCCEKSTADDTEIGFFNKCYLIMGNKMLRSLVVFGYGEVVHKMSMAGLTPFSLNEKHSLFCVVWKVSESESLVFPVFFTGGNLKGIWSCHLPTCSSHISLLQQS